MEIQYRRTYAPPRNRRYTAGEITALLGFALEIASPRAPMAEGKLLPGETCMLLFAITPEEYALRESAPERLDKLADELEKKLPADRLLAWRVCDLKGAPVKREAKPRTTPSIDDGAFQRAVAAQRQANAGPVDREILECARIQRLLQQNEKDEGLKEELSAARKKLGAALITLEKLYIAMEAQMNGRYPAVGLDGRVEIFTQMERARRAGEQMAASVGHEIWTIQEIPAGEMAGLLRRLANDGLGNLRVDNGFAPVEISAGDILLAPEGENARLRALLLREVEAALRLRKLKEMGAPQPQQKGATEAALTLSNFAHRELGLSKLYLLSGKDGRGCACVGVPPENKRMLAVFTEKKRAVAFQKRIPGPVAPLCLPFAEAARRAEGCEGLLIDGEDLGYRLMKTHFARVQELKDKPPMAVRLQEKEAPKPEAEGLPNPDSVFPPEKESIGPESAAEKSLPESSVPAAEKSRAETPAAEKNAPEHHRGGIFKRLFGRKKENH